MNKTQKFALFLICIIVAMAIAKNLFGQTAGASSKNFIVRADTPEIAQTTLKLAEHYRTEIANEWLGGTLPEGVGPTVIRVRDYENSTSWVADSSQRLTHMIWCNREGLAHEIAHTVLATRYPGKLPAWVQEGIASQYDGQDRRETRNQTVEFYRRAGFPSIGRTLEAVRIVNTEGYVVSESLVELLCEGGAITKEDFLQRIASAGGPATRSRDKLAELFGFSSGKAMEVKWREFLKGK